MSLEELPLPVICLVLERIKGLTPERLVRLSSCFSCRKWLRACREDVPWRAALSNTGGARDIPKSGLYRWVVDAYVPSVAKAVADLRTGFACIWSGSGFYGEARARLVERQEELDETRTYCEEQGVGSNLQPGFVGMKKVNECLHPFCRARKVQVFSCVVRQTGNYFTPQQTHSHWLQCRVCQRIFWFEEVGYG